MTLIDGWFLTTDGWLETKKELIHCLSRFWSIYLDVYIGYHRHTFLWKVVFVLTKIIYRRGLRNQCAPVTVNTSVGLYMYFDYLHAYSASWLSSSLKNPFWLKMFWSLLIHVQVILHNVLSLVSLISKNSKHGSDMVLLCTKNYLTSWKCHNRPILDFPLNINLGKFCFDSYCHTHSMRWYTNNKKMFLLLVLCFPHHDDALTWCASH